jgi:hypothetical protein
MTGAISKLGRWTNHVALWAALGGVIASGQARRKPARVAPTMTDAPGAPDAPGGPGAPLNEPLNEPTRSLPGGRAASPMRVGHASSPSLRHVIRL